MMSKIITGAFLCLFCLSLVGFTDVQSPQSPPDNEYGLDKEKFVERHNYYRKQLGIPAVEWSNELADYAQEWAEKLKKNCEMKHRSEDDYGENIYWTMTAVDEYHVVDYWAEEAIYFDHRRKIFDRDKSSDYGHYTQLIWKETTHIGAVVVTCENGSQIWVCNYDPPGNWIGEKVY